jgi:Cdc6-like AAA superfamily ATPase
MNNTSHFSGASHQGLMVGQNYGIIHNTFEAKSDLRHRIVDWLFPPESSPFFRAALDLRHPDTGTWLLKDRQYQAWRNGHDHFLWLHGIPGCGKSVLTAAVIDDVQQQVLQTSDVSSAVAYFYFTFRETRFRSQKECFDRSLPSSPVNTTPVLLVCSHYDSHAPTIMINCRRSHSSKRCMTLFWNLMSSVLLSTHSMKAKNEKAFRISSAR